mmetsp:Transcript_60929/g.113955  ORF Transcript_60929/g.113955 Transcript_60929/m.113955 type:complete len:131 (+) Transcript_60929:66-458(+)
MADPSRLAAELEVEADHVLAKVSASLKQQMPAGIEVESTILAANLPFGVTSLEVGSHFAWYAPVIRVMRLEKSVTGADSNYLVTFVDAESANSALHGQLGAFPHTEGSARPIRVEACKKAEATMTSWFGW